MLSSAQKYLFGVLALPCVMASTAMAQETPWVDPPKVAAPANPPSAPAPAAEPAKPAQQTAEPASKPAEPSVRTPAPRSQASAPPEPRASVKAAPEKAEPARPVRTARPKRPVREETVEAEAPPAKAKARPVEAKASAAPGVRVSRDPEPKPIRVQREPQVATRAAPSRPEPSRSESSRSEPSRSDESSALAGAARQLAAAYLSYWSAPNVVTMETSPSFYAQQVLFHGRRMSARALFEEKRRFVRRWPERSYVPFADSMRTSCAPAGQVCTVRTLFAFTAANPDLGKRSRGTSTLDLIVSFEGNRPVIVSESSQVVQRGRTALLEE